MTTGSERWRLSRDFKLEAILRMEAGENVSALARDLGVRRKLLYEWRDAWREGGPEALRGPGRPRKGSVVVGARSPVPREVSGPPGEEVRLSGQAAGLRLARRRIAELERKVGQQALEADFFRQALRLSESFRQPSDRPGGTAPSPSFGRGRGRKAD